MNTDLASTESPTAPPFFLTDVPEEKNTTAALTLPQRAAAALKAEVVKAKIKEAVAASADITEVLNVDARHQAHRIGMTLMKLRTGIKSTGKLSREDAQAFSKAVIKAEDELVALITPEETRIMALRDAFDDKVRLEEEAKAKAETDRVEKIEHALNAMRAELLWASGKRSDQIAVKCLSMDNLDMSVEFWQEYHARALEVRADVIEQLESAYDVQLAVEQEALRVKAEQEAEAARVAEQALENARVAAELERVKAEFMAAHAKLEADRKAFDDQQQAIADKAAADAAAEVERQEQACSAEAAELLCVEVIELSAAPAPRDESHLRVMIDRDPVVVGGAPETAVGDGMTLDPMPLSFAYDEIADVLTVEGINYAGEIFRRLADVYHRDATFRLAAWQDDVVTLMKES